MSQSTIILYENESGNVELRVDTKSETLWATQEQIASLFQTQRPAITKHLRNIFISKELEEDAVGSILELTAEDGKRYKVKHYNLDALIAIGYRVNSKKATQFRIWATKIVRDHVRRGYSLNEHVLTNSSDRLDNVQQALSFISSDAVKGTLK